MRSSGRGLTPSLQASEVESNPILKLALMGAPMAGEEGDLPSSESLEQWQVLAANSAIKNGHAATFEQAMQLVREAL
jgi:hypothetical protein